MTRTAFGWGPRRSSPSAGSASQPAGRGAHRHRPHALGDPRRRQRAERPPPPFLRRPDRRRPQRHHREPRGAPSGSSPERAIVSRARQIPRSSPISSRRDCRQRAHAPRHRGSVPEARIGTFAVLATVEGQEEMYAMKRDSPLVLGVGGGRTYVASDIYAFSDATDRAMFFENDEFAVIRADELSVLRPMGEAGRESGLPSSPGARGSVPGAESRPPHAQGDPGGARGGRTDCCSPWSHDQKKAFDALIGLIRRLEKGHLRLLRDVLPRLAPGRLFPPSGRGRDARRSSRRNSGTSPTWTGTRSSSPSARAGRRWTSSTP